ncbi:MAG: hypothetical protein AB2689_09330 [Candidatus Thiodiazotropha taylori]
MNEALIIGGGIYMVALIVFHVLFWRIFKWPETLMSLNRVNKSTIQVLNISLTFIFAIFAYISFFHTDELLNTQLGNTLLILISLLWLFRAAQQLVFYDPRNKASIGLTVYFLVGAVLYGIPAYIQ